MTDREQTRRDAEYREDEAPGAWARRLRGLLDVALAELEQAERERDEALRALKLLRPDLVSQ